MKFPSEIQLILDSMQALSNSDIVPIHNTESSMLSDELCAFVMERFQTTVMPAYEKELEKLGGVDGVLKDLEDYIVKCIDTITQPNPQGEAARKDFNLRREISGQLGKYHTALRALLDDHHLITWESVLHLGATKKFKGLWLRQLLAYTWLAARDENMEISDNYNKEVKKSSDRIKIIDASKANFIAVLEEIRRAHNENLHENSLLDNPSCLPGTVGRIAIRASIYNKLTAFSSPSYIRVPKEIENFIIDQITFASDEIKEAAFDYLNTKIMEDEINEPAKKVFFSFIETLTTSQSINNLLNFLQTNGISFAVENGKALETEVLKIFNIYIRNIKLEAENAKLNGVFANRLLTPGLKFKTQSELEKTISAITLQYRLNLRQLSQEIKVLVRLVNNELVRGILVPQYAQSEKYVNKLKNSAGLFQNYMEMAELLQKKLDEAVEQKVSIVENHVSEETSHNVKMEKTETKQVVKKTLSKETLDRLTDLQNIFQRLEQNFTGFKDILPVFNQQKIDYYARSPLVWAQNIARIATEREQNGDLVRDTRELQRLTELMQQYLSPKEQILILKNINEMTADPEMVRIDKIEEVRDFIQDVFNQYHLNLRAEEAKSEKKFVLHLSEFIGMGTTKYPEIFSEEILTIAKTPLYRSITEKFDEEKYQAWKKQALAILSNDIDKNHEKYKNFVILTIFANLEITEITLTNIEAIEWLVDLYLGRKKEDMSLQHLPYKLNPETDLTTRINYHAGALCMWLTTLKNVFSIFNSGHICLMSREIANEKLKNSPIENPYIIRLSNTTSDHIVISHFPNKLILQHDLLNEKKEIIGEVDIEGYKFKLRLFTTEDFTYYLKKHPHLKNPIGGLIPLEEAIKDSYKKRVHQGYVETYERLSSSHNIKQLTQKLEQQVYLKIDESDSAPLMLPKFLHLRNKTNNAVQQVNASPTPENVTAPAVELPPLPPLEDINPTQNVQTSTPSKVDDSPENSDSSEDEDVGIHDSSNEKRVEELDITEEKAESENARLTASSDNTHRVSFFTDKSNTNTQDKRRRNAMSNSDIQNKINRFQEKFKLDMSNVEHLEYWNKQVRFNGGVKYYSGGEEYALPHGIHAMMLIIQNDDAAAQKLHDLSNIRQYRNKKGSYLCLPIFKLYRKSPTDDCYEAASHLKENHDESTPLLSQS